jgi:hypothetical protein
VRGLDQYRTRQPTQAAAVAAETLQVELQDQDQVVVQVLLSFVLQVLIQQQQQQVHQLVLFQVVTLITPTQEVGA